MWQLGAPNVACDHQLSHSQKWQLAFINEWCRLAEGRADLEQTADAALEIYTLTARATPKKSLARNGARLPDHRHSPPLRTIRSIGARRRHRGESRNRENTSLRLFPTSSRRSSKQLLGRGADALTCAQQCRRLSRVRCRFCRRSNATPRAAMVRSNSHIVFHRFIHRKGGQLALCDGAPADGPKRSFTHLVVSRGNREVN
jgi:hypothetical protein